ncbi:MAG TPA: hypothetical protein EYP04_07245 [Anaerolineae bacterium]|nr:hypothetical protein [Anaerolineae bacterium]
MFNFSWIERVRQHHAIEHATIHILSQRYPTIRLVGRSDLAGFYIYGSVSTEAVRDAAQEALRRLQAGENELAVHPNCGTNLVTAGVLSGIATWVATSGRKRSFWEQLPSALSAALVATLLARPLGYFAQERITTQASVDNVRLRNVTTRGAWRLRVHRVIFDHS